MENWDEVRTAYQVARIGTVSGAAKVLGVHHATVIRHIDALESRLGAKLFQRHPRGYTATEAGQGIIAQRGDAWRNREIPAVMANPLEIALGTCWPWADDDVGTEIRDQWTGMIADAAKDSGVTLAVVPLRVLAEKDGVLDQLEARDFPIIGPEWR